jgi:hypothetical protein
VVSLALVAACGLDVTGTGTPSASPGEHIAEGGAPALRATDDAGGAALADDAGAGGVTGTDAAGAPPIDAGGVDAAPDAAPSPYPASCTEVPNAGAGIDVVLYWDKDPTKPYDAHCQAGATYVRLNDTAGKNTTTYPMGTASCTRFVTGQTKVVTTTWTMLRFDPTTHLVDTSDFTFATSVGGTHEDSGNNSIHTDYLKMPYASGRVCDSNQNTAPVAKLDLTKTKLAVAATQAWSHDGFEGQATAMADPKNKAITLNVGGYSAGGSPCPANADYYTTTGGKCLLLTYAP